ncbi:MAG: hypothetical protein NOOUEUKL_000686 [Candidatus Fervidibacter sp.]|jgi:hypothetical protein
MAIAPSVVAEGLKEWEYIAAPEAITHASLGKTAPFLNANAITTFALARLYERGNETGMPVS